MIKKVFSGLKFSFWLFIIYQLIIAIILIASFVHKHFWVEEKDLRKRYGEKSWVVITGGSSGQGRQFALQFAERGFNIFIIGSKRSFLVEQEIRENYKVETKVLVKDFGEAFRDNFFDEIKQECEKLDISLLINNVGHRSGWIPSHKQPIDDIIDTISCGTLVQVMLTNILIEKFKKRPLNLRSGIVFITVQAIHSNFGLSLSSNELSIPFIGVYESANVFGRTHANAIYEEYHRQFDILNITPGAVITEKTGEFLRYTPFSIKAEKFVENIIRFLGNVEGTQFAYWGHDFGNFSFSVLPLLKKVLLPKVGRDIATSYMLKWKNKTSYSIEEENKSKINVKQDEIVLDNEKVNEKKEKGVEKDDKEDVEQDDVEQDDEE